MCQSPQAVIYRWSRYHSLHVMKAKKLRCTYFLYFYTFEEDVFCWCISFKVGGICKLTTDQSENKDKVE